METSGRKRRSKVISLPEAASIVTNGMMLGLGGGHSHNSPAALVRELIRKGIRDLTLVPINASGYQSDILLGAGCVKTVYVSYIGLDYIGTAPNFRRLSESGKLDVVEFDEMGLLRGLKVSAAGLDFFPLPDGFRGVDVLRVNPDFYKEIDDPFTGKRVVVVRPIRPDVAVIHVAKCDPYGNAREAGYVEVLHPQAANKVIVTTDEIVPLEDTKAHYKEVTVFGKFVDAVVEVPYGSHPGECHGAYQADEEHLREYQKAARDDTSFKQYLDKYVYQPKDHTEYLDKIGMARLLKLKYY